ncbi:MAG: hypothetical protein KW788_01970 [Candidatus Doudnabacteria bacterium]|nr:hypothetical protein [Candidatus Doudnabacteria bacterium]
MLQKPTQEIETAVFAEYDADYVGFCVRVFEEMERTNPQLADLIYMMKDYEDQIPGILLGLQLSSVVYEQLRRVAGGQLPIVEMRPSLRKVALEAIADPKAFVNKFGTPYFYDGLIGKLTLAACAADGIGHGVGWEIVVFVVVFMIRILEAQVELDLAQPKNGTH